MVDPQKLRQVALAWLEDRVEAVGFAPAERFVEAPARHFPGDLCPQAATVIVYGTPVPAATLDSPLYGLHALQRGYHSAYTYLDHVGLGLANLLEREGFPSLVVPSYAPLVFHGAEPWGILSLKHAAVLAGLGAWGRNGLVFHPRYGSLLRLGAVVTAATMPGDAVREEDPCPPGCDACRLACPSGALSEGGFQKMVCLGHSVKHGIYRHVLGDRYGRENLEMVINTTGYNYWIDCAECLRVCPLNGRSRSGRG